MTIADPDTIAPLAAMAEATRQADASYKSVAARRHYIPLDRRAPGASAAAPSGTHA